MPVIAALPAVAATAATVGMTMSSIYAAVGAVAAFTFRQVLMGGASSLAMQLIGPKQKQPERQASITSLSLGEQPRVAVFGRAALAGTPAGGGNFGGADGTDWEVLRIALADHECDALEGVWVDETFHAFVEDGPVDGFSGQLKIYWRPGAAGQTMPDEPDWIEACDFVEGDDLVGVAHVWVGYRFNPDVWPQGRPRFLWRLRGAKLHDPRKDPSVPGGDPEGTHSWDDPSTREWSENAYLARWNWARGLYACNRIDEPDQLLIGRGFSEIEAPAERAIARANICDEPVAAVGGGIEARYRVGGVVSSDQAFVDVEEMFAAAMAGVIVQADGGVDIDPGAGKTAVFEITDADLAAGEPVRFSWFGTDADRINTVSARYVAPDQRYQDHAAPIRRDPADLIFDGGPRLENLTLTLVTSNGQAQRCAEIKRRLGRLFRRATIVLGPRFQPLEEGDWGGWTSERWHEGARVEYRVVRQTIRADKRVVLSLEEIEAEAFDEPELIAPGSSPVPVPPDRPALALEGVEITAASLNGQPAILAEWETPVASGIDAVTLEVRRSGETVTTPTTTPDVDDGRLIATNGVRADGGDMEARLVPRSVRGRATVPSDWITVSPVSELALHAPLKAGALVVGDALLAHLGVAGLTAVCSPSDITAITVGAEVARLVREDGTASRVATGVSATIDWGVVGPGGLLAGALPAYSAWGPVWLIATETGPVEACFATDWDAPALPSGYVWRTAEPVFWARCRADPGGGPGADGWWPFRVNEKRFTYLVGSGHPAPQILDPGSTLGSDAGATAAWVELAQKSTTLIRTYNMPPAARIGWFRPYRTAGTVMLASSTERGGSTSADNPPEYANPDTSASGPVPVPMLSGSLAVVNTQLGNRCIVLGFEI